MKKLFLFFALGAILTPSGLSALITTPMFLYEADPYVSLTGGVGRATDYARGRNREIQVGNHHGIALAFGYEYTQWRFELEGAYRRSNIDGHLHFGPPPTRRMPVLFEQSARGKVEDLALMFNGIYSFPIDRRWRPYAGAGVGFSYLRLSDFQRHRSFNRNETTTDGDLVLAFQMMLGIVFSLNPDFDLTVGYRYFATQDVEWSVHDFWEKNQREDLKFSGTNLHLLELGLKYRF